MYSIQIHSMKTVTPNGEGWTEEELGFQWDTKNVFLDISSEGQRPRRYFMGSFKRKSKKRSYESIIHYTGSPVTLSLNHGPFRYQNLGQTTIYNFLQSLTGQASATAISAPPDEESEKHQPGTQNKLYVVFGQRGASPLFKLCYSARRINCSYQFALNEITCLKQFASSWRQDKLFAEVEYNHSPHSIDRGPRNKFSLGTFSTHDVGGIHSLHNLTFSTVSNFVITFYAKTLISEYILGTIKFTPLAEMLNNMKNKRSSKFAATATSSPSLPPAPISTHIASRVETAATTQPRPRSRSFSNWFRRKPAASVSPDDTAGDSTDEPTPPNTEVPAVLPLDDMVLGNETLRVDSIVQYFDYSALSKSDENAGGLLVVRIDSEAVVSQFILPNRQLTALDKITLAGASGGAYEILYSIKKHQGSLADHVIGPKSMWASLKRTADEIALGVSGPSRDQISLVEGTETELKQDTLPSSEPQAQDATTTARIFEQSKRFLEGSATVSSREFSEPTVLNHVELMIDGLDTFKRYYELMMSAQHSISLLAWEVNLAFGLVLASHASAPLPAHYDPQQNKWITFEDVIVSKAKEGVAIRIIVWRHELLSHVTRYLYLGEVTIEAEVAKLERRCKKLGLTIKVFHTVRNMPPANSPFADPDVSADLANIVVIIAGNPKGLISTHHEKLLLIDPECPDNTVAFTGGFDIARGRYDQPAHLVPVPFNALDLDNIKGVFSGKSEKSELAPGTRQERFTGKAIQPSIPRIRFLWHDIQLLLKGPVTRLLHLHFIQRWHYAFSQNPNTTKSMTVDLSKYAKENAYCSRHRPVKLKGAFANSQIRLERTWKTVFDANYLFEDYCRMIKTARKFLYIEHQYPFQNFTLTHLMCEALKANQELKVIIVTPVKTDLPTGVVGELFDWSQDHIVEHLNLIHGAAPDRVGIFALVNQDPKYPEIIKPIYVHTKLCIVDDQWMLTGSTNMDNVSFFYSSELSIEIRNPTLVQETRKRLFHEHLGSFYNSSLHEDFDQCLQTFKQMAGLNQKSLKENGLLIGRVVAMAPLADYNFTLSKVYYPNKLSKMFLKFGVQMEDVTQLMSDAVENVVSFVKAKAKL